jgi:N6-L-threonylcarbamoyladenine synthase
VNVLGIETSCDECSVAVVENGKTIRSNVVATQIEIHRPYNGVVPEIASRLHTEWIRPVVEKALEEAGLEKEELDGVAVTNRPGLVGSLLVGLSFAKGFAYSLGVPLIGVNHIEAHLYAPHLEYDITYPYLGVIVSGGHTIIAVVSDFDSMEVLGTTIDDACGEAFDKVAKHYKLGFPGGVVIDKLSAAGNPDAASFPFPSLHKGDHPYDVSYSGLKTAVINQLDQFWNNQFEKSNENIAAAFQKTAIDILVSRIEKAAEYTGLKTVVLGGGVAANSYLRERVKSFKEASFIFPSLTLCTDNGAMIAGLGYHYLNRGDAASLSINATARVANYRKTYP